MNSSTSEWTVFNDNIDASENSMLARVRKALGQSNEKFTVLCEVGNHYLPIPYDGDSLTVEIFAVLAEPFETKEERNLFLKGFLPEGLEPTSFSGDMHQYATLYFQEKIGTVQVKKTFNFEHHVDTNFPDPLNDLTYDSDRKENLIRTTKVYFLSDPESAKQKVEGFKERYEGNSITQ